MADRKPHRREAPKRQESNKQVAPKAPTRSSDRRLHLPFGLGGSAARKARTPLRAARAQRAITLKGIAITVGIVVVLMLAGAIGLVVLSHTDAFTITSIDTESTEHVTAADIATLAGVPEGTTLLNYDEALIIQNLSRNPWIKHVSLSRAFPDRLRIVVEERTVESLVMMNAGSVIWSLGDDNVWIEPVKLDIPEGKTVSEVALEAAVGLDALLITDVPQAVSPVAGAPADDEVFAAISTFREEFSSDFWDQIVSINASSLEGISCTLASGLEISLGSATSVTAKEAVIQQLLAKYPNRLTYINVRVPANPSYRMVETESVEQGTGIVPDLSAISEVPAQPEAGTNGEQTEAEPSDEGEGYDEGEGESYADYSDDESYSEEEYTEEVYTDESYSEESYGDYAEETD